MTADTSHQAVVEAALVLLERILAKVVTCPARRSGWAQWLRSSVSSCCGRPAPLVLVWPQNGAVMLMQPRRWPDVPGLTSRAGAKMIRSQPPPSMSCLPALLAELLVVGIIGASLRRGS